MPIALPRHRVGLAALVLLVSACAGPSPLLHPAHPLSQGTVRFAAGTAVNVATGELSKAIDAAQASTPTSAQPAESFVRGSLAAAAVSPGVSPFVAARVGLGSDAEGGLSYTGRTARADGRWVLHDEAVALSLGLGGSMLLGQRDENTKGTIAGLNMGELKGWGIDAPVIVGWRSPADLLWLWGGVRAGYEKLSGSLTYQANTMPGSAATPVSSDVDARRLFAGGLVGLAVGLRHLHAAIEMHASYQSASGTLWNQDVKVDGLNLTPAAALLGSF